MIKLTFVCYNKNIRPMITDYTVACVVAQPSCDYHPLLELDCVLYVSKHFSNKYTLHMNRNKCGWCLYRSSLSKNYSRIRRIHSNVEIPIFWPFRSRPSCFSSWVVQVPDRENKWTLRKFLCSTSNFHWVIDKYRCKKATWAIY